MTAPLSPEIDRLVAEYERLRDADEADRKGGALRVAMDKHEAAFGWQVNEKNLTPADRAAYRASFEEASNAEDQHAEDFGRPRWAAAAAVYAQPAQSLHDIVAKFAVAESEGALDEAVSAIASDVRRMAGEL